MLNKVVGIAVLIVSTSVFAGQHHHHGVRGTRSTGRPTLIEVRSHECPACAAEEGVLASTDLSRVNFVVQYGGHGVVFVPTFILLDSHGKEIARVTGFQSSSELQALIARAR